MFAPATAAITASYRLRDPGYSPWTVSYPSPEADQLLEPPRPRLSDTKLENGLKAPGRIASQWLTAVQERVRGSIIPEDREAENDGRWLSAPIAAAALTFFNMTSDLLPSDPYLYSSKRGDLVAEFETENGSMTGIITQESAMLFAVVDGVSIERRLVLGSPRATTRNELQLFTEMLRTRRHGPVEPRS